MDVGIQKAGQDDLRTVSSTVPEYWPYDLCHGDVRMTELVGEDVDIGGSSAPGPTAPPGGGVDAALFSSFG